MKSFVYKGKKERKNYFEGWYVKLVDEEKNIAYAIIFGVSLYEEDKHAFIQILNDNKSVYKRYELSEFHDYDNEIRIGTSYLSEAGLGLYVDDLSIDIKFKNQIDLKRTLFNPGIMGFFQYLNLNTYHEVVFVRSEFYGIINEENVNGLAYMEKDRGNKFPEDYIWLQSNHFDDEISFLFSVAKIKVLFFKINGFFSELHIEHKKYRFATYNRSKIIEMKVNNLDTFVKIKKGKYRLEITASGELGPKLIAPIKNGEMEKEINESITSSVKIVLKKKDDIIYEGIGRYAGYEQMFNYL